MIYFILGFIAGGGIVYLVMKINRDQSEYSNLIGEKKKENLAKIENLIAKKSPQEKITNDEVQEFLKVSDATAERYLNNLEQNGKIKQCGKIGKDVYYRKS